MAKQPKLTLPTVLAFEKKLVPSDGFLYGGFWGDETFKPLSLFEKSVRGTISNRQKPSMIADPLKLNAKVSSPNPQRVDSCTLGPDQNTVKLVYSLKVLGGLHQPTACNNTEFLTSYQNMVKAYIKAEGFTELARRYVINIANGRTLWRNRAGASDIMVNVHVDGTDQAFNFDGKAIGIKGFTNDSPDIRKLTELVANALCASDGALTLNVTTAAKIGYGQTVYPSQELVMDDRSGSKEKKSKVLYSNDGIAALHEQKIGNALRTIDTWFADFDSHGQPIAIETYGAVTNLGKAFRVAKGENFYSLFDSWVLGDEPGRVEDKHYVMATLVRGGVFGGNDKE